MDKVHVRKDKNYRWALKWAMSCDECAKTDPPHKGLVMRFVTQAGALTAALKHVALHQAVDRAQKAVDASERVRRLLE